MSFIRYSVLSTSKRTIAVFPICQTILANIPEKIADRTKFLGIIREIAAAIKDVLDAVNLVSSNNESILKSHKGVSLCVYICVYVYMCVVCVWCV